VRRRRRRSGSTKTIGGERIPRDGEVETGEERRGSGERETTWLGENA
jgi:hypothetical protein